MTQAEIIVELRARPSQTVPFAGDALGSLKRGASYAAAKTNSLGVPVFWSGGKLRTASIDIARRLGVEDKVAPVKTHQQAEDPLPLTPLKPAPQPTARKSPAPKAIAARKPPTRKVTVRHRDRQPETVT
jgi:hypothetical protein